MNTVDKHTPGLWKVMGVGIYSAGNWHIATINPYSPESSNSEANASLIASAPDLLKALQQVVTCDTLSDHLKSVAQSAINKALNI